MSSFRTLIVDDEPPARKKLVRLLAEHPDFPVVGEAGSGREAIAAIATLKPNIVLLDVQMPDMDGFAVMREAPGEDLHVVFVTAHDDYALAAFEAHAFDYLLKPVSPERFTRTLERIRRLLPASYPKRLLVEQNGRGVFVATTAITRVEAARNYIVLYSGGETFILRSTLDAFGQKLDPEMFFRIHRSHLVNVSTIKEITPLSHGDRRVLLQDGTELLWSRRYQPHSSQL